jgi:hypothetical protein
MPITTPTKGANAMNGICHIPFILALMILGPIANTTTMKVPITSTINFF